MKTSRLAFVACLVSALPLSSVSAAPAKPAPAKPAPAAKAAPSAASMDLAKLLISKENYGTIMSTIRDQTMAQANAAADQSGQKLPADTENKLKTALGEALPYDDIVKISAAEYTAQFTADEVTKLVDFYKTALGQKLAKVQPQIGAKVMMQIMDTLQKRMPAAAKKAGLGQPGADDPADKPKPKGKPRM